MKINTESYKYFKPGERLDLVLAALTRDDEAEANRLLQHCPLRLYRAPESDFANALQATLIISQYFYGVCVEHYYRALMLTACSEIARLENKALAERETMQQAENQCFVQLTSACVALKQFCREIKLDAEDIITMSGIYSSCPDIKEIFGLEETDAAYVQTIKHALKQRWYACLPSSNYEEQ